MRNGRVHLAARHAEREDGRVARRVARPARRPRHGRPRLGAAPLRRQAPLALHGRLARRVVARDRRTAPTCSVPGTARSGRSTCKRTGCAGVHGGGCKVTSSAALAGSTLYIGDYCGRLLALSARTGALRFSRERQRPRLRHAGRRRRARVRPELDRRLADRVLDRRTLPLAPLHRLVRLLLAGGRARARVLRLVQRRLLRALARRTARRSGRTGRAARSPAPPRSSTASPTQARSRTASSASTCAAAASS